MADLTKDRVRAIVREEVLSRTRPRTPPMVRAIFAPVESVDLIGALGTMLREQNDGDAEQALAEHFRRQFAREASPLPASNPVELDRAWLEVRHG